MKRDYKTLFWVLASLLVAFYACAAPSPLYVGRFTGDTSGTSNAVGNMIRAELFGITPYRTNPPAASIGIAMQIPSNLPDQTTALQNVINIAASTTNRSQEFCTVRLPWGVYRFTSALFIPDKVRIVGEGGLYHSTSEGGGASRVFNTPPYTILWCSDTNVNPAVVMTNGTTGMNQLKDLEICGGTNCLAGLGQGFNDPNSYEMLPSGALGCVGLKMSKVFGGGQLLEDVGVCGFRINVDFIGGNAVTFRRCQWPGGDVGWQSTNFNGVVDSIHFEQCGAGCRAGGIEYVFNNARDILFTSPNDIDGAFWGQLWNSKITMISGNLEFATPSVAGVEQQPAWCYVAMNSPGVLVATNGWWSQNDVPNGFRTAGNFGIFNYEVDQNLTPNIGNALTIVGTRISSAMTNHIWLSHSGFQGLVANKVVLVNAVQSWPVVSGFYLASDDGDWGPESAGASTAGLGWARKSSSGTVIENLPIDGKTTTMFVADKQFSYVAGKLISVFSPTNTGVGVALYADSLISGLATNGSTVFWPDLSFNQLNLTNQAANTTWPTTAWTNGFPAVRTAAGKYLIQTAFTNTQPFEVVAVSQYYVASASDQILFDSATGGTRTTLEVCDAGALDKDTFYAGSSTIVGSVHARNKFRIIDVVFNGASSTIYTNGVLEVSGNPGANNPSGFTLSGVGGTPTSNGSPSDTTFLLALSGTNTVANRTALTTYLKNRFNVN